MRLNPFRSLLVTLGYLATGRLCFRRELVGKRLTLPDGRQYVIFRHVVVEAGPGTPGPGATFIVQFHLAGMSVAQNIRFSLIPIPFFVGLPGFRSKLWSYCPETGDFAGIYEWSTVQDAENYAASFAVRFMTRRSVPGSVRFEILPGDRRSALSAIS
ncbi:MAG: hypothetical protein ACOY93_15210 [Bacillota bacterium]